MLLLYQVTSEESVKRAIELAVSNFSCINCVINCAGVDTHRNLIDISQDKVHDLGEFERIMKVTRYICGLNNRNLTL